MSNPYLVKDPYPGPKPEPTKSLAQETLRKVSRAIHRDDLSAPQQVAAVRRIIQDALNGG